jgi:hypothetical protein
MSPMNGVPSGALRMRGPTAPGFTPNGWRKAWEVKRLHPTRRESACSQGGRVFCDWKEFDINSLSL